MLEYKFNLIRETEFEGCKERGLGALEKTQKFLSSLQV